MSDTVVKALTFKPGINKNQTEYLAEGGWVDCDKIRFRAGRAEKIGGWQREQMVQNDNSTSTVFTGITRHLYSWSALDAKKFIASGSHQKLEIFSDGKIYDITPVESNETETDVVSTTDTSNVVKITITNHGRVDGDFIYVNSQAAAVGGITLSGGYIVTYVDTNNFTVVASSVANATANLAGGNIDIDFLLKSGYVDNGDMTGYGGGTYGTPGYSGQGYNRPRAGVGGVSLRNWSLDNWGEDLVACPEGGGIYLWDRTGDVTTRASIIANAPTENTMILVAMPSRHLCAFGSQVYSTGVFDPLIIRWSSSEDYTDWDASSAINTAGEYRLPKGNAITAVVQTSQEIIIFTDSDVYSMRATGTSDVFQFTVLGKCTPPMSQHCVVDVNGTLYWIGIDGFYTYNGTLQVYPTSVDRHAFSQDGDGRINAAQKEKAFACTIRSFNEIIFCYPSLDNLENSNYIKINYVENVADVGTIVRTAWIDEGAYNKPYATDTAGKMYLHEQGKDADGAPLEAYIRSAYFDIEDGNDLMFVDRIIPDMRLAESRACKISIRFKKYTHPLYKAVTKGPYSFDDTMKQINVRGRGRQMSMEFLVDSTGGDFEIGKVRIAYQPDGRR